MAGIVSRATDTVPARLSAISTRWLSEALGAPVGAFDLQMIGTGAGLMGQLARVRPLYEGDAAGPASVIVKLPSASDVNRAIGCAFRLYEREVRFYECVGERAGLRVPHCFHATVDDAGSVAALVLEDLGSPGDQVAGATLAEARAAVAQLARLHATWWDDPRLADLPWMPLADDAAVVASAVELVRRSWPAFVAAYGATLTPEARCMGERLPDRIPDLLAAGAGAPSTINHGDYRLDNLYFGVEGSPCAVGDWQLSTRARTGIFDLVYFLGASVDPALRARHGDGLVRLYLDALEGYGVRRGHADLDADMARAAAVCLVYAVAAGAEIDVGDARGRQLVDRVVSSYFRLALDLGAASVL